MTKQLLNAGPSEAGWHRLQTVLRCPRLYALGTDWDKPALVKGSLVHIGLAHHYKRMQSEQRGEDPDEWYRAGEAITCLSIQEYARTGSELWMQFAEIAQRVVENYEFHWNAEQWEIIGVEKELRANVYDEELDTTYLYTQRADLIVRDRGGNVHIIDHKSTARIAPKVVKRYALSGQMLGYQLFGRKLWGEKFAGVMLNMLQFPKSLDGKFEFTRPTLESAPVAVQDLKQTIIYAERIIRKYKDLPPNEWPAVYHETACWTPYGECPKANICKWGE